VVILYVDVPVRRLFERLPRVEFRFKVIWRFLFEEVPRRDDACRHVVSMCLWDDPVKHGLGEIRAKIARAS
jgi:hypothetical protein